MFAVDDRLRWLTDLAGAPPPFDTRVELCLSFSFIAGLTPTTKAIWYVKQWKKKPENKERLAGIKARSDKKNRATIRKRWNKRMQEDIQFRIGIQLRSRLACAMKRVLKGAEPREHTSAVNDLGCTMPEFLAHLESQFTAGMNFDNYGDWHIDHIEPISKFDLENPEEVKKAVHFTNLQPLWAADNIRKGNRTRDENIDQACPKPKMRINLLPK